MVRPRSTAVGLAVHQPEASLLMRAWSSLAAGEIAQSGARCRVHGVTFRQLQTMAVKIITLAPCMDGARGAREKNLTLSRNVRVQPCIRPLNAAVVAAGPDVIR